MDSKSNISKYVSILVFVLSCASWAISYAVDSVSTFTYKKVDSLEIKLDLYAPGDCDKLNPVVVWIHGGALMTGYREDVPKEILTPLLEAGCAVISIDYRLAPETLLPEIIADLEDAFTWIRDNGPELLNVDPDRIVVIGASAGGYLTLTAGYRVKPRPLGLVSLWGYGDLIGDWYSKPVTSPWYQTTLTREEAFQMMDGPPVSNSRDRKEDKVAEFYRYTRMNGIWPEAVTGWDSHEEAEKFYPYMPLKNITTDYPPTLLVHGTKDGDVPYENSVWMSEQLERHCVEHELITMEDGGHGFQYMDKQKAEQAIENVIAFIKRILGV